jgi:hypothetical protein
MVVLLLLTLQDPDPRAKAIREAYEEQLRRDKIDYFKLSDEESVRVTFENGVDLATFAPESAVAFLRVWIKADQIYPALIEDLEGGSLREIGRARLLNRLSGRRAPLPNELTRDEVKKEWETWLLRRPPTPSDTCDHDDARVRRRLRDLSGDSLEERVAAETELKPCAGRHAKILEEAIAATTDVEALARLRALRSLADDPALRKGDLDILRSAVALIEKDKFAEGVALLRAERERFQGTHRETVDLLVKALERRR